MRTRAAVPRADPGDHVGDVADRLGRAGEGRARQCGHWRAPVAADVERVGGEARICEVGHPRPRRGRGCRRGGCRRSRRGRRGRAGGPILRPVRAHPIRGPARRWTARRARRPCVLPPAHRSSPGTSVTMPGTAQSTAMPATKMPTTGQAAAKTVRVERSLAPRSAKSV